MSGLYLREWRAAAQRSNNNTPDLFSDKRLKVLGLRRTLVKLGAAATVDLESLDAHALEQLRVELAAQLSSRTRGTRPTEQQPKEKNP